MDTDTDTDTDHHASEDATPTLQTGTAVDASATRRLEAEALVHRNVLWAFSAGILPIPMFDLVAITGVQLKMLKELSELYGVEFREGMVKKAVSSMLVGVGGVGIGGMLGVSLFKFVPIIGYALGVASVPVVSGALTHAFGRAFIMHFESGGTMLDFDPKAMRGYFETQFREGKEAMARMQKQRTSPGASPAPAAEASSTAEPASATDSPSPAAPHGGTPELTRAMGPLYAALIFLLTVVGVGLVGSTRRLGFVFAALAAIVLTPIGGLVLTILSGPRRDDAKPEAAEPEAAEPAAS